MTTGAATTGGVSRRSLLTGLAVAVVGGIAGFAVSRASSLARPATTPSSPNGYGAPPASGGARLIGLSQLPAGGGVVLANAGVVVTKSAAGAVHGFSSVCTHQGCTVGGVQNGAIVCPCHGSRFNALTGAVVNGPATRPLPAVPVVVRNGAVFRA